MPSFERPERRNCTCPCHAGAPIMHVIGCCVMDKTCQVCLRPQDQPHIFCGVLKAVVQWTTK